ncbi:alpha/beta fold hydrolase [Actinosynnema sp. CS-041913]|uniref:alpha/beta fold hydrolase n=1 Tax=Actinosynnema sp. CS-041913 TaxID=3239917 RepID=UPI003D92DBCF
MFAVRGTSVVTAAVVALAGLVGTSHAAAPSFSLSEFKPCDDNPEALCAVLSVPERWGDPRGGMIDLLVAKRSATASGSAYKGVLLADAGGPHGNSAQSLSGNEYHSWYKNFTEPVREAFDIVAINEREGQIKCEGHQLGPKPPLAPERDTFDRVTADNERYAAGCRPEALRRINSLDRARDLDALRRALGVVRVSFYGVSYGTVVGQVLADRYPGNIRSMVLDSPQYPRLSTRDYLVSAAAGIEDIAHGFARWCEAHQEGQCRSLARVVGAGGAITTEQVIDHLRKLSALAEQGKLKGVTPDEVTQTFNYLNPLKDIPGKLAALADTLAGWEAAGHRGPTVDDDREPSQTLLRCNDFFDGTIKTYEQWSSLWQSSREVAPIVRTADNHWTWMRACLGTGLGKAPGQWRPKPFPTAVPLLVTSMRYDGATPWNWARELANDASARLITYNGFGHGAYDATIEHQPGRDCVAGPVEDFLVNGVVPAGDKECRGATAA